jgi:hypothetical protein
MTDFTTVRPGLADGEVEVLRQERGRLEGR